jgi:hypothetical protein
VIKKLCNYSYYFLGILGAVTVVFGHLQTQPQLYYIFGSCALLITAIHYNQIYFIALEIILASGHFALLLGLGAYIRLALPLLLCIQLLIFYIMYGKKINIFLVIGILGIELIASGFVYNNQWIFFMGGLFVAIYSYYDGFKGKMPSFLWAILNSIFSLIALYKIII